MKFRPATRSSASPEGETSSDSSSSSEDAVEEVPVLTKKVVKAKPVATADAAKGGQGATRGVSGGAF